MNVLRPCTIIAVGFFIAAFALAITIPPDTSLAAVLALIDPLLPGHIHGVIANYLPPWVWVDVALPLLLRPAWLFPATIGIVFGGAALTLHSTAQTRRSRHHPR